MIIVIIDITINITIYIVINFTYSVHDIKVNNITIDIVINLY